MRIHVDMPMWMAKILQGIHPYMESYRQQMVTDRIYMLLGKVPVRLFILKLSALNTSIYKQHFLYLFIC